MDFYITDFIFHNFKYMWLKQHFFLSKLLYVFPKILLALYMLYLLYKTTYLFYNKKYFLPHFLALVYVVSIIFIISYLKHLTGISCPWSHRRYDSLSYDAYRNCFPAAHAIVGFAYFSSILFTNRNLHFYIYFLVVSFGWLLGFYQMLRGAHFFSHTMMTMLLAYGYLLLFIGMLQFFEKNRST